VPCVGPALFGPLCVVDGFLSLFRFITKRHRHRSAAGLRRSGWQTNK
jgi:hypothetical protein